MSTPFEFDGYRLHNANDSHEALAEDWTKRDEHHAGMDGRFWLEKGKGVETFILEGADGEPLFFLRLDKAIRMRIQFAPNPHPTGSDEDRAHRVKMRDALTRGMAFLDVALSVRGFREVIFDSVAPLLRAFTIGRLRFAKKPNTLTRALPSFTLPTRAERITLHAENNEPCADPTRLK